MLGYQVFEVEEGETQNMRKIYNFNAGPAMLPYEVLLKAQTEMFDWHNTGMSPMELGHRGSDFKTIADDAEKNLRELLNVPANYQVLFLAGGASLQFAMVPLNLMADKPKADYIETGIWSKKASSEAKRYGDINIAARAQQDADGKSYVPTTDTWNLSDDAAYVHYTPNETIDGIEFPWVPKTKTPLVADMTSNLLTRPINVTDYGIIYAGAQKNLGQAGITVVIIRDDLIKEPMQRTPTLLTYSVQAENHSLYNTPPTYAWYISGLVLQWSKAQGGVQALYEKNKRKAETLYSVIDQLPEFYESRVRKDCRSMLNVMFYLRDESLTPKFLEAAKQIGLINLRGHRVSGGVRASIYNPMPEKAVNKLAEFMTDFAKKS